MRYLIIIAGLMALWSALAFQQKVEMRDEVATQVRFLPGHKVEDFTAVDSNGKIHRLADYKGKVMVLEWSNPDCPYSNHHYATGVMQALQEEALEDGTVWFTVLSTGPEHKGFLDAAGANALAKARNSRATATLMDETGALNRHFGVNTTPHIVIIDKDGTWVYSGAVDSSTLNDIAEKPILPYVADALISLELGEKVKTPVTSSYGCMIHSAKGFNQ